MIQLKTITILAITLLILSGCFNSDDEMGDVKDSKKLLISQPCLPVTDNCEITLEDNIKLRLQFLATPSYQRLLPVTLKTNDKNIQAVSITMLIDSKKMPSEDMKMSKTNVWEAQLLPFANVNKDNINIRLLVTYKESRYFAEFPMSY